MSEKELRVAPHLRRLPAHPSITPGQISDLVERFYGRVRNDERLGPIFEARVQGEWGPHLAKMKGFWRSVLLKTGEYKGRPVPVHVRIGGLGITSGNRMIKPTTQVSSGSSPLWA